MTIESVTAVTAPLPDPPDGFGTQLSFAGLPDYMKHLLRVKWHALTGAEQECVRRNLEDWDKSKKSSDFSGPLVVGPIPEGADNATSRKRKAGREFTKGQTYGDFSTITEPE